MHAWSAAVPSLWLAHIAGVRAVICGSDASVGCLPPLQFYPDRPNALSTTRTHVIGPSDTLDALARCIRASEHEVKVFNGIQGWTPPVGTTIRLPSYIDLEACFTGEDGMPVAKTLRLCSQDTVFSHA